MFSVSYKNETQAVNAFELLLYSLKIISNVLQRYNTSPHLRKRMTKSHTC